MLLNLLKAIGTWFLFIIPAFILVPYALFDCCRWSFKIDENKRLGLDIDEPLISVENDKSK